MIDQTEITIDDSGSTGIEWTAMEGREVDGVEIHSVIYNRGLERFIVNYVAPQSRHEFDQLIFDADDEDAVVSINGDSAVGVPNLSERPNHYISRLVSNLQGAEIVSSLA